MKIGIDIREAREGGAGKGRYTFELVKAMLEVHDGNTYVLFDNREASPLSKHERVTHVRIKGPGPLWHLNLWWYLRRNPLDWMLSPTSFIYAAIAPHRQNVAIIVHDLIAFLHAHDHPALPTFVEKITLARALRQAKIIGCISKSTEQDLIRLFPNSAAKVEIIPPAVPSSLYRSEQTTMDLPPLFMLSVGTLLPRKNITLLLRVMERLHLTHPSLHLYIVGKSPHRTHPEIADLPANVSEKVHFLGQVTDLQLRELYSRAAIFAFPSLYEGFGLPPLEAMSCGCPVIASNRSSIPEAVGSGGLLVDPDNVDEWVKGVGQLLQKETAQHYRELGYAWVTKSSWSKAAHIMLDALCNKS